MKPGVYETTYGNAALISGKRAFDLDMGEFIPLSEVTTKYLRPAQSDDRIQMARAKGDIQ